ncbi:hypothetical protein ACH3WN_26640 [Streptomyces albogriseolus]|uniref:hypothetical protein n=1 Tax=Streptomyces albogriseolus TaxID=1887 RepID=UPI0037BB90EB
MKRAATPAASAFFLATCGGDVLAVAFSANGMTVANASPSDAKLPQLVVKA